MTGKIERMLPSGVGFIFRLPAGSLEVTQTSTDSAA